MKDKYEITYVNNNVIGQFIDGKYVQLTNDKKLEIFDNIKDKLETKDRRRKMFSLVIGITLAMCAIILAFLMITKVVSLGSSQWYTYTIIIAGLVLLWVLLYYLFGLVFYSKLEIDIHFKGSGNFADNYAKSNYAKWVNRYKEYLGLTTFSLKDKKKSVVSFGLCTPSTFKNIIFNFSIYYLRFDS